MTIDPGPPTAEELAECRRLGLSGHVAAGYIAARRGGDVKGMYDRKQRLHDLTQELSDIIDDKMADSPKRAEYRAAADGIRDGVKKMYGES